MKVIKHATYRRRRVRTRQLGISGCNSTCPKWRYCNDEGPTFLPCEVYAFLDENPALLDTNEPTPHPAINVENFTRLVEAV
ncbi:MAG: hypothetical protein ACREIQ_06145 [Nitrospiria bacterium]